MLPNPSGTGRSDTVEVGLRRPCRIQKAVPAGVRVTVRIDSADTEAAAEGDEGEAAEPPPPIAGTAVPPSTPREQARRCFRRAVPITHPSDLL